MSYSSRTSAFVVKEDDEARKNFDSEIRYNRWLLSFLGLWPSDHCLVNVKFTICFALIILYSLPSMVRFKYEKSDTTLAGPLQIIVEVAPLVLIISQIIVFKCKSSKVGNIVEKISEDLEESWKLSKSSSKPMLRYGFRMSLTNGLCRGFFLITSIVYYAEPIVRMLIMGKTSAKLLPNKGIYPFSADVSPNYEIVYIVQTIAASMAATSMIGIDGFLTLSVFHGCAQLSVLAEIISHYDGTERHADRLNRNTDESFKNNCSCLKCIVDRHVSLTKYVKSVDDVYHGITAGRLIMSTVHFCASGYLVVKSNEESNFSTAVISVLYTMAMTSSLFMYCWLGEQLTKEGENLGQMAYKLTWYDQQPKNVRSLILLIVRSRRPLKLTAGKFFIMSFTCYKEWFVRAVGYISVLLAIESQN